MFELTIKDQVYQFNFGMGFMREINKTVTQPVEQIPGQKENIGLRYKIAAIMGGDIEALVEVLVAANKYCGGERVTSKLIDEYIDDAETDLDKLFKDVMDFLESANATKKAVAVLKEAAEKQKAKEAANQ